MTDASSWINRRNALRLGLAAGVGALAAPVLAKAPLVGVQAPTFYRFKFGEGEATIVSDGVLPLGDPHKAFLAIPANELDGMLSANFLPLDNAPLEQNTLVVNFGDRVVIFDNGMGNSKLFGDTTGKLMVTLAQAGIKPEDVDALVMTHAHIDHCGGIMSADGKPNFPNAQYFISESDFNYWTDPAKVGPNLKAFLDQATKNLLPVKERITWIKDGQEILPGVHAISAPGHTVGHTIFMIQSGKDQICYIGDVSHHPVLLLEKPLIEFAFDTDPKMAAKSRVRVLEMLAANKTLTMAYHFAWPGIGHVVKMGEGFHWVPAPIHTMSVGGI